MKVYLLAILLGAALHGCVERPSSEDAGKSRPEGQRLFERYCKGCHGKSGDLSFGGAARLSASSLNHSEIEAVIRNGRGNMLGFERLLTPAETVLVAEYVKRLQKIN